MLNKNTFELTALEITRVEKSFFWMAIPAWNPDKEIGFPIEAIPEIIQPEIKQGRRLMVYANLKAVKASEMHLERFQLVEWDEIK